MSKINNHIGGKIYSRLDIKPTARRTLDIGSWRRALKAADQGKVKELHELYDDILLDTKLTDAIGKRIEAVLESNLTFINADKEEVEEITSLMETLEWEELLTIIMQARFWGRSGAELSFADSKLGVEEIPGKHINLKDQTILLRDTDRTGIPYKDDPFIIILGKERSHGLLLKVAPYVIYKRGGFGDWAQWIELFGMPQRVGKYNIHDPESRAALEEALERAGSAPWLTVPEGTAIENVETSTGNGAAYDDFRKACNEELTVAILGQTLTTTQGDSGARALGEVHQEIEAGKHRSDLRYVQRILNQHILPRLEARGYPVARGKFIFPDAVEQLEVADVIALSDIMDIPKSYLHERYAIPMAADGEAIARRSSGIGPMIPMGPPDEDDLDDGDDDDLGDDEPKHKHAHAQEPIANSDEVSWWQRMMRFFGFAPGDRLGASTSALPTIDIRLSDAASINDRLIERTIAGELGDFDVELWRWTCDRLITALQRGFNGDVRLDDNHLSITYGAQRDALITAMEINLYRFGASKTLAEAQHLNQLFRQSKSVDDFRAKAGQVLERYNRQWLETEYNTAHLSALAAAKHQELKTKTELYPFWEYKTVGDGRVRAEHAELNGVILRHDDPLWNEIYPPNGYNCRCSVEPRLAYEGRRVDAEEMRKRVKTYQETKDWEAAKAMGWDSNRATLGQVFAKTQQYVIKFPGKSKVRSQVDVLNLKPFDYGLDALSAEISKPNRPKQPRYDGTAEDWYKGHQTVSDYNGRTITMHPRVYKQHTTGSHKERVPLLTALLDTLQHPDEVWLNDPHVKGPKYAKPDNLHFIKFYDGVAFLVTCQVSQGKVYQVNTWFNISTRPQKATTPNIKKYGNVKKARLRTYPQYKYRRGLLITKRADT